MTELVPAILAKSVQELSEKVALVPKDAGILHIDILERDVWSATGRDFEVHLMVRDPEWLMEQWHNRGAKRIIVHRLSPEIIRYKSLIELGLGVEMGVALEDVYGQAGNVSFVHLMSIEEMGAQGHPLDERIFDRIRKVREKFPKLTISVDGGIDASNFEKLIDAGANRLVVGSHFDEVYKAWISQTTKQ